MLATDPVAEGDSEPTIVITTDPPAGKVGIDPLTLLPLTVTLAGHTAPPFALAQLAVTPLITDATASANVVAGAGLGPALEMSN